MENKYQAYDASVIKPIIGVQYDIISEKEIEAMSALTGTHGIEVADLYDKNEPKRMGLIDPRMGGPNIICATCKLDGKYCVGHPAHIDLAEAVFHPLFLQYVKNILDCICLGCSNLLVPKDSDKIKQILKIKSKRNRFVKVHEMASKVSFCLRPQQNCGIKKSTIKVEIKKSSSAINIYSETDNLEEGEGGKGGFDKKKQKINLTPEIISDIFDNISDEDREILGIERSKPSDMIHKKFLVPPVHVRPSLRGYFSGGSTMEDGLTHKLADIVKANTRINKQKETNNENSTKHSKDHAHLLQFHVATYYAPDMITAPKDGKGSQFKPLVERLKGKGGRIRGNLMGKRGNFNARTVITSDPTISANYLGVPVKIAMNVTFPEFVTRNNIDRLSALVRNGVDVYPGANYVYRGGPSVSNKPSKPIYLKSRKEEIELKYGDVVERHLENDDIVLLNRQPTLHKQSMMAHRIKVIDDPKLLTYRLSAAICTPYNADFDGDEMNVFVPQSIQSKIELEEIADVKKQIITPSKSVTIYGIVQDGLLGAYNLTDEKIRINWRDAMNIMSYTSYDDFKNFKKDKDYKGSELFSMIIPPKVTMRIGDVEIKNGELIKGKITNAVLGAKKKNNILQFIWDEYGEDATRNFIDNCQRLVNNFNLWNGFTVGIGDAQVSQETKREISQYISNVMNKLDTDITAMENNPSFMDITQFEGKIFTDINVVRDDVSKITIKNVGPDNSFGIMANSGAKGGSNNLGQMIASVGHQAHDGGLMAKTYADRTLCYFHENDDRARSRGLCTNSYMDGLSYSEFCYHTRAGRAGLIEQVVKTSETGYAQRKLIKTMEDVMVKNDWTVRIGGQILHYVYGGNGADTSVQYEYVLRMNPMDNQTLEKTFKFSNEELKEFSNFSASENESFYQMIKNFRDDVRRNFVKAKLNFITMNSGYMLSVNIERIIASTISNAGKKGSQLTPEYVISEIESMLSIGRTPLVRIPVSQEPSALAVDMDRTAKMMLRVALYDALYPRRVIKDLSLSKETFDSIIQNIEDNFNNNIVEPGSMVGIIAAQSMGEAVTQMTLNAFHHSGIASLTHSTMGVPRVNELISATKNPKTPTMYIYLNDSNKTSREMAHKIGSYLEKTTIGTIISNLQVIYDPSPRAKNGYMERDGVQEPYYSKKLSKNSCQASVDNLPWLIRIEVNKEKMLDREVTLLDIKSKFCLWWDRRHVNAKKKKEKTNLLKKITSFAMASNTDNDPQPVIHIRFNVRDIDKTETKKSKESPKFSRKTLGEFASFIEKFKLKGIENIDEVTTIGKERFIDALDGDGMAIGEEHVIYTAGVNLKEIRYLHGVNPYKCYSDDVIEMFSTFGIEIARNRLLAEFLKAYENAGNSGLNPQHIAILVDIMCFGGSVISADRHGMKKANVDPLSKASFEKPVEIFSSAAVFGEKDKMNGVSSRLSVGQAIRGGTGYCDIVLDLDMIQNSEYIDQESDDEVEQFVPSNTIANAIMEDDEGEDIYIPN